MLGRKVDQVLDQISIEDGGNFRGHCCFDEKDASVTVDCARSDGKRQLSERSHEPMPKINIGGKFVVAAANILDKGMADADHPY